MIALQRPFIVYSARRAPFHDGAGEEHAKVGFVCTHCGHAVESHLLSCLAAGTAWFRALLPVDRRAVSDAFGCLLEHVGPHAIPHARFPNGRPAYFCTAECAACRSKYVLAIDFHERQPARYIGLLQGAAALDTKATS